MGQFISYEEIKRCKYGSCEQSSLLFYGNNYNDKGIVGFFYPKVCKTVVSNFLGGGISRKQKRLSISGRRSFCRSTSKDLKIKVFIYCNGTDVGSIFVSKWREFLRKFIRFWLGLLRLLNYAECRILFIVVVLSVIMLSVVMLSVVAP